MNQQCSLLRKVLQMMALRPVQQKKRRGERDPCTVSPSSSPTPTPLHQSALESSEYPDLSDISKVVGVEMTDTKLNLLFCEIAKRNKDTDRVQNATDTRDHVQSYLNVPVTASDESFQIKKSALLSIVL